MVGTGRHRLRLSVGMNCVTMKALMEQRRIISVIFLIIVVAVALILFAQYNRPAEQAPPAAPTGMILSQPVSVG
jgi:hypothetical protein